MLSMKIYKEYVILGVALLGALVIGTIYLTAPEDHRPTVDNVIPTPLDVSAPTDSATDSEDSSTQTEERTDEGTNPSDGTTDALPS
jgi:hypothetical protein